MRTQVRSGLTALAGAAVVLLLGGGTSASTYGIHGERGSGMWETSLQGPLFDEGIRWVPGDTRATEFTVRNGTDVDGVFSLHVRENDPAVAGIFTIGLGNRMGQCAEIPVRAGVERGVVATVHMSGTAMNETQRRSAALDVVMQWGAGGATSACARSFDEEGGQR